MIYRLLLSYRGTRYAGWQRQNNALAVQEVVEKALEDLLGEGVAVLGSSRTDAGVHARGQVAHFHLCRRFPSSGLIHGTNQKLPEDVRVLDAAPMPEGFDARRCSSAKTYRYRLRREAVLSPLDAPFVVPLERGVEVERMRRAASLLVGRHDFSAFAKSGGNPGSTVRVLHRVEVVERDPAVDLVFSGEGFLRGMVRALVGTLLEVGRNRLCEEDVTRLLAGGPRSAAGPNAPARGLVLERVDYPPQWMPPTNGGRREAIATEGRRGL